LWEHLLNDVSASQLVDALKSEYEGASDEELSSDVDEFLSLLKENGVLE